MASQGITILPDGTIRIGDLGSGQYIELAGSSWQNTTSKVQTQINNWLSTNKYSGWTVTVTSLNPKRVTISSSPVRMN
jgi:hypothetical protein